jgi:Uma2 family endonuclease
MMNARCRLKRRPEVVADSRSANSFWRSAMTRGAARVRPPGRADKRAAALPPLEAGDHLDQKTFHARYEAMPPSVRAELIGGVVYMPSPLKPAHGETHIEIAGWLWTYKVATPGVEGYDNVTAILSSISEVQPDACLIIAPEKGGQMRVNKKGYLTGAPELVAEVASSSESYDLHSKKADYEKAGVREYVVAAVRPGRVYWFVRRQGRFEERAPDDAGVFRSEVFPGLWLDPEALLRHDSLRVLEVLRQGLATPEHAAWVARLAATKGKAKRKKKGG